jgi:hypothetical protein
MANEKPIQIFPSDRDRAILNKLRASAVRNGIPADKVQPSKLRVAMLVDASKSSYEFNIKKDQGTSLIHDRKLDINDSFVATDLGMMLLGEDPAKPGTGLLQTFPNNTVFAAETSNVTPLHLNIFYNGGYKIKVGDTVYAEHIPTEDMLCVRTTQQSASSNFSERFLKDGTVPLTPDITLGGSSKNEITLNVPTFSGLQLQYVTAATRIYVVFVAYGFLITGGSKLGSMSN